MFEEAARTAIEAMTGLTDADKLLVTAYLNQAQKADDLLATEGMVGILNIKELRMLDTELHRRNTKVAAPKSVEEELKEFMASLA